MMMMIMMMIMLMIIDLLHVTISKEDKRRLSTQLERNLLQVGIRARPGHCHGCHDCHNCHHCHGCHDWHRHPDHDPHDHNDKEVCAVDDESLI